MPSTSQNPTSSGSSNWRSVFGLRTMFALLLAVAVYGAGWAHGRVQLIAEMSEYEKENEIRYQKMVSDVRDRFGEATSAVD